MNRPHTVNETTLRSVCSCDERPRPSTTNSRYLRDVDIHRTSYCDPVTWSSYLVTCGLLLALNADLYGQSGNWQPVSNVQPAERLAARRLVTPVGSEPRTKLAETGKLPKDAGQVWREYDIRSFTRRLPDSGKPEQLVVDWILRETGTNTWFGEPLGVLSANREIVRIYHTPRIQETVKQVIDRFLNTRSEANQVNVRLVTVDDPNWRIKALPMLTSVKTQTPGIEAWLLSLENSSLLLYELEKRMDFQEHNSPNLTIYSGQTHTIKSTRPRTFNKAVTGGGLADPFNVDTVDEGFILQISPLIGKDGRTMDAVIKCGVDQIEGFTPLWLDGADQLGVRQRLQLQIPQISSWRLHERFRWPTDSVLLISRGLVATPGPTSRMSVTAQNPS